MFRETFRRSLETLGRQPKATAIKEQAAHAVATAITECKNVACQDVLLQNVAHQATKSVDSQPTIGHACLQEDSRLIGQPEHVSNSRSNWLTHTESVPANTLSSTRFGNRMCTGPRDGGTPCSAGSVPAMTAGISTKAPSRLPRPLSRRQYCSVDSATSFSRQNRF
jgi:hypothetical protein